ncbi:hypothetical protein [Mucilaginibacter sp.]
MKIKLIGSISLLWLTAVAVQAQQRTATTSAKTAYHPQSVQLNVGTVGIGAAYNYGFNAKLALQAGLDVIPIKAKNVLDFSDFNSKSDLKARFTDIYARLYYTPFKNAAGFRLAGGLAYFAKAKGTLDVQPSDSYKYGDIQLTPDQVGHLTFTADWQGVAPYAGIALFPMFPKHKFNVNLDLGSYYLKQPEATITGTGNLQGNASQNAQFQENIKGYRWLPVIQLNFNYKF